MTPTHEQLSILDAAKSCDTSLIINAMAGCAKTTSLEMLAKVLPIKPSLAVAFNVKIKKEMEKRLPKHFEVMTLNGLGHRAWSRTIGKRCGVNTNKLFETLRETFKDLPNGNGSWATVSSLVRGARHVGLIPEPLAQQFRGLVPDDWPAWEAIADYYYLDISDELVWVARRTLSAMVKKAFQGDIDYDDQIYCSCQPAGTKVLVCNTGEQGWYEVPIEKVQKGMKVISFNRRGGHKTSVFTGLYSHGSEIEAVASRDYMGVMYTINAGGFRTRATSEHKWLVRFVPDLKKRDVYFTYLMKKEGSYRIGQTQVRSIRPDSSDGFGLAVRSGQEVAEASWILGVHYDQKSSLVEEAMLVAEFGITDKSFLSETGKAVHSLQKSLPDIETRVRACLRRYLRDIRCPFWTINSSRGFSSNFIIHSCNLIPEIMEIPTFTGNREPDWQHMLIEKELVNAEQVYSLKVGTTQLYVADNILTHNSLFGGIFPRFSIVMVDEAQDLSPLNHLQIKKVTGDRAIVVGDPRQAIYAFRGADSSSMASLRNLRDTWLEFPLSTTFRCPKKIVARQQTHAPGFTAADTAPEGEVDDYRDQPWSVPTGTLAILCRNNAPIIAAALRIIRGGKGCTVLGSEIGKSLVTLSKKLLPHDSTASVDCVQRIGEWRDREIALARANGKDEKISIISDRADCLLAVLDSGGALTSGELRGTLTTMFSKENNNITLSTIHKAKGLEWDTVIHLDPWRLPSKWARKAQAEGNGVPMEQEMNLNYVCETRTKRRLILANLEGMK